ncbi:MAG: hypothetical protein AB8B82_02040 [Roseovarius sp.]
MNPLRHENLTRRRAISTGIAALCMPFAAYAGGDGGGNSTKKKKKRKPIDPPVLKHPNEETVSVDAFLRMDADALIREDVKAQENGKGLIIEGFGRRMSASLVNMMKFDPRSTRRLVRDMRKLSTKEKRKERLSYEISKQDRRIEVYKVNIRAGRGSKDEAVKASVQEDRLRRQSAEQYRRGVREWHRTPDEGLR